jgi:hypothetical protein
MPDSWGSRCVVILARPTTTEALEAIRGGAQVKSHHLHPLGFIRVHERLRITFVVT